MNDPHIPDDLVREVTDRLDGLSVRRQSAQAVPEGHDQVDLAGDLEIVTSLHERLQQRLSGIGS